MESMSVFYGLLGFTLLSATLYYTREVFRSFRDDPQLAATKLVLKSDVKRSFRYITYGTFIFSISYMVRVLGYIYDDPTMKWASYLGTALVTLTFLDFTRKLAGATGESDSK